MMRERNWGKTLFHCFQPPPFVVYIEEHTVRECAYALEILRTVSELHWTPNSNSMEVEFHNRKFVELELERKLGMFLELLLELYQ